MQLELCVILMGYIAIQFSELLLKQITQDVAMRLEYCYHNVVFNFKKILII